MYHGFHKNSMQQKLNKNKNKNVSWAPNQHIRMISEGSCDTEDWKFSFTITGINYILKYIVTVLFKNILFSWVFDQIHSSGDQKTW